MSRYEYTHDTLGRLVSFVEHNVNPLRYRGYYWDQALGMYYLQSRFYDPAIGRFINADAVWVLGVNQGSLLQYNLFTYCLNNPVMMVDPTGFWGCSSHLTISWGQMTQEQRIQRQRAQVAASARRARAAAVRQAGHTTATMVAVGARVVEINGEWRVGIHGSHLFIPSDATVNWDAVETTLQGVVYVLLGIKDITTGLSLACLGVVASGTPVPGARVASGIAFFGAGHRMMNGWGKVFDGFQKIFLE